MKSLEWTRRSSLALTCLALSSVVVGDWLLFDRHLGINLSFFAVYLIAMVALRENRRSNRVEAVVLSVLSFGLAFAFALQPTVLAGGLALLFVLAFTITINGGLGGEVSGWVYRLSFMMIRSWWRFLEDLHPLKRQVRGLPKLIRATTTQIKKWGGPTLFLFAFVLLFRAANPIIAVWLDTAWELVWQPLEVLFRHLTFGRLVLWGLIFAWSWALLRPKLKSLVVRLPAHSRRSRREPWGADVVAQSLWLFNLIFLVQTILDLYYLWGGQTLPEGMTYAEYAHRGAYPLIATALLAGAFVLYTFRPGGDAEGRRVLRGLVYVWIIQNITLVLSSLWRLGLYIEVYSLTRLRVAAGIWMVLVAVGLLLICLRIALKRSNSWLIKRNLCAALTVLYLCCFPDFDSHIAWYNVSQFKGSRSTATTLDLDYLESLGTSSIPALHWYSKHASFRGDQQKAVVAVHRLKVALQRSLSNWRGWTLRRAAERRSLVNSKINYRSD